MKVTVAAEALQGIVRTATPFLARNASIITASGFLVGASGGELRIAATNLDHSVQATCPAEVAEAGEVWVSGALAAMVGHLSGAVDLAVESNGLRLTCDGVGYTAACGDAAEFPRLAWPTTAATQLDDDDWDLFSRVAVAAYNDTKRGKMSAVNLFPDGYVLGAQHARIHFGQFEDLTGHHAAIPRDAIALASKALAVPPAISFTERTVAFSTDDVKVLCTLAAERFDEFPWRVLPNSPTLSCTVEAGHLLEGLAAASAVRPLAGRTHVRMELSADGLALWRRELDVGEGHVTVPAEGDFPGPWAFDSDELAESVRALRCDPVVLTAADPGGRVLIEGDGMAAVVMPGRAS